ncbi:MAG: SIS domain-containing protein [Deinococcota bacterium]
MNTAQNYFDQVTSLMQRLFNEESESIHQAGALIADTIADDRLLHIFGTGGHSAMSAEEIFFRAGGLVAVNAILDEGVLLAHGALRSNGIERTPGYALAVLEYYGVQADDVLVVVNAYGINACTIDAAEEGKRRNCKVIAVTSVSLQQELPQQHPSRHPNGQNLADIADVVIDCKVPMGDALIGIDGVSQKVGASSTYLNALALNLMMIQAIENLAQRGIDPPIWQSANSPGGDEANKGHVATYKQRIKKL